MYNIVYYPILIISAGHQKMSGKKIKLCSTKAIFQRTQLFGVKALKTQKLSISIGLSYSGFSFYEQFSR